MGPLAIIKVVADIAKFFVDAMFDASKLVAELQRDMGLTAEEAEAVRQRTYEISENSSKLADTQGKIVILQKQIVQSQKEINDSLDTQIDLTQELGTFGKELLVQSSILRDNFRLSTEAVAELDKEAIRTGKSVEDITKETFGTIAAVGLEKGILLDVNKILTEATKIQGNLRLSFKGSTTELSKAVAQAKTFRVNPSTK
jgi:TolA-binding protein